MASQAAKRDDWQTEPLPLARAPLDLPAREFTSEERERLLLGVVPQVMEDRWFVFAEHGRLYFHRSWTGHCIFEAALQPHGAGWRLADAWVNREPGQYGSKSAEYDAEQLLGLCNLVLNATRGR